MKTKIILVLFTCLFFNAFSQDDAMKEAVKDVAKDAMEGVTKDVAKESNTTTFYLINSAEKKPVTEEQKDPYLTDGGLARSKKWAEVLNFVKLDAIYAVEVISAKQTAQSISEVQKTSVYEFDSNAMYDASFKYLTNGKNVLIVSDNSTSTKFANLVLGAEKYTLVENSNYGVLHIITVVSDTNKIPVVLNIN